MKNKLLKRIRRDIKRAKVQIYQCRILRITLEVAKYICPDRHSCRMEKCPCFTSDRDCALVQVLDAVHKRVEDEENGKML